MAAMGAILIAFMLAALPAAFAIQHIVGGSDQLWVQGVDYDKWAQGEKFTVGDTLLFTYSSLHSVYQVTETNYGSCNTDSPIKRNSGGSTTVTLPTPGTYYFICATGGHCASGMKVAVTVPGASGTSPPSSGGSPPNTPPSSTTSSPPPPSGSTGYFRTVNCLVVMFSLFVAKVMWF
ncbi:mavicyanin-like [Impatiens glandulifera]|uniref:mavicyanin-like n=1 Tax=Impatiens glandulifera TaxID=253017 RepID=UPI001FB061F7|nr:mavicyanin-like [Impatiens glandulifera]